MPNIGRRDFLRLAGATLGTSALAGCDAPAPLPATPQPTPPAAVSPVLPSAVPTPAVPPPSARPGQRQRLTGPWQLLSDPKNLGRAAGWFTAVQDGARPATVPGMIQDVFPGYFGVAWYWLSFEPLCLPDERSKVLVHFAGGVDYLGDVWLNGQYLGGYEGGEGPFDVDATTALRPGVPNLLAVRVLDPTDDPIDGYLLKEVPHRNKTMSPDPGSSSNYGGIMQPVELRVVPLVRIVDAFVRPDPHSGQVSISLTLRNDTGQPLTGSLIAEIGPASGEEYALEMGLTTGLTLQPGEGPAEVMLTVDQPRLWELYDPFLYRVSLRLETEFAGAPLIDERRVRAGFREFRVENGYFRLNGRRIFVRSSHTGSRFPFTAVFAGHPDQVRQDLVNAKAAGFNMIRFIWGMAAPEQLEFCDEMGLLVYQETYASWPMAPSPGLAERYDRSLTALALRDRNHPSFVIYGLLNETSYGPAFVNAVKYLPRLRQLDQTRLVLLNSGRFDAQWNVGSLSNPGSDAWEYVWGAEGPDASFSAKTNVKYPLAYLSGAGDAHFYPRVPQTAETDGLMRELGRDTKPVFLSEYGIGSLLNATREAKNYEEMGADAGGFRVMADLLAKDWQAWGMDSVYPFVDDLLVESQRLHNRQRLIGFNLIRANPRICGYSLTSLVDGMTGEGLWTFSGEWKSGTLDTLTNGWAALRWCLFVRPMHVYSGRPFQIEAVLANDGVLVPGTYPVTFRMWGPQGLAWERQVEATLPAPPDGGDAPLAVPVLLEDVTLAGPAGTYRLAVSMPHAAPAGDRLTFFVSDEATQLASPATVLEWGLDENAARWLATRDVTVQPLAEAGNATRSLILVGLPPEEERDLAHWTGLMEHVARGSLAIFLDWAVFQRTYQQMGWLPLANRKGFCADFFDWLYHKECVAKPGPVFAGLAAPGIMDWDYYGPLINNRFFTGQKAPDEVLAASFATGYPAPNGYVSGILLGSYGFGAGHFIINAFRILENLGQHPAADRLLLNLIEYGMPLAAGPAAPLPADWQQTLTAIDYVPQ